MACSLVGQLKALLSAKEVKKEKKVGETWRDSERIESFGVPFCQQMFVSGSASSSLWMSRSFEL